MAACRLLGFVVVFAAYVDVAGVRAHGEGGDQGALDQLLRIVAHDVPVLAGAGLALVGVDDEVARPPVRLLGHEAPLHARREPGAAAAAQAAGLDLLDDRVPPAGDDPGRPVPVPALAGGRQAPVVQAVEVGEDAVLVGEHGSSPARPKLDQRRRPALGRRGLAADGAARRRVLAAAKRLQQRPGAVVVEVLVVVDVAHLQHGRVHAGAEALDLAHGEHPVRAGLVPALRCPSRRGRRARRRPSRAASTASSCRSASGSGRSGTC